MKTEPPQQIEKFACDEWRAVGGLFLGAEEGVGSVVARVGDDKTLELRWPYPGFVIRLGVEVHEVEGVKSRGIAVDSSSYFGFV